MLFRSPHARRSDHPVTQLVSAAAGGFARNRDRLRIAECATGSRALVVSAASISCGEIDQFLTHVGREASEETIRDRCCILLDCCHLYCFQTSGDLYIEIRIKDHGRGWSERMIARPAA